MKVTLYYGGAADRVSDGDDLEMENIILFREIELARVPNVGEDMTLHMGDYMIDAEVKDVFTHYCEPGNPHKKESFHGDSYAITLHRCRIVDRYKRI